MDLLDGRITKNSGIYLLLNRVNGHMYVGQSKNIKNRVIAHITVSQNPNYREYYTPLHKDIRKYGAKNFAIFIIEEFSSYDITFLSKEEKYWISYYNTYHDPNHYNLTEGGLGVVRKYSEKEKEQLSKRLKQHYKTDKGKKQAKKHSEDMKGSKNPQYRKHSNGRKVMCIETREIFPSTRAAAKENNCSHTGIGAACNGKQNTCNGFHWKYI